MDPADDLRTVLSRIVSAEWAAPELGKMSAKLAMECGVYAVAGGDAHEEGTVGALKPDSCELTAFRGAAGVRLCEVVECLGAGLFR